MGERRKSSILNNPKTKHPLTQLLVTALLLALISSLLMTSTQAQATPQIQTDKPDYSPEEIVTIYGTGFASTPAVTITVTRPAGPNPVSSWTIAPDSAGSFTTTYQLDGIEGTYIVTATQDTQTVTTSFTDSPWKKVTITTTGGSVTYEYPANSPTITGAVPPDSTVQFTVWAGTKIKFTANPSSGFQFKSWTGNHFDPTENPQTLPVGSGKCVTAIFIPQLVVPEYSIGALMALAACFVAFIAFKRPRFNRK